MLFGLEDTFSAPLTPGMAPTGSGYSPASPTGVPRGKQITFASDALPSINSENGEYDDASTDAVAGTPYSVIEVAAELDHNPDEGSSIISASVGKYTNSGFVVVDVAKLDLFLVTDTICGGGLSANNSGGSNATAARSNEVEGMLAFDISISGCTVAVSCFIFSEQVSPPDLVDVLFSDLIDADGRVAAWISSTAPNN